METIEPKERGRIEEDDVHIRFQKVSRDIWIAGAIHEHLHLQNTVIEPLRKENEYLKESLSQMMNQDWAAMQEAGTLEMVATISKLEAENKELKEEILNLWDYEC